MSESQTTGSVLFNLREHPNQQNWARFVETRGIGDYRAFAPCVFE